MRLLVLLVILCAGCGRTPTAPPPYTCPAGHDTVAVINQPAVASATVLLCR